MADPLPLLVLFVGQLDDDLQSLRYKLVRAGYLVKARRVATWGDLCSALLTTPWQMVVARPDLPNLTLPQIASTLEQTGLNVPLIVVTGRMADAQFGPALRVNTGAPQTPRPATTPLSADRGITTAGLFDSGHETALGLPPVRQAVPVSRNG